MNRSSKIHLLYRLSRYFFVRDYKKLAVLLENYISFRYGCFISPEAIISSKWVLPHPTGVIVGANVLIEDFAVIYQGVTLGRKNKQEKSAPKIRAGAIIYANSVIVGDVEIGKGSIIGALTFVNCDVRESEVFIRK